MSREAIGDLRQQKDHIYKTSPNSPLLPEQRETFTGLNYYPYNSALDLTVTVDLLNEQEIAYVHTTRNEIRNYTRYAQFTFQVGDEQATLTIYQTPHGFFIPFVDANAGKETYPAGRYIDPEQIDDYIAAGGYSALVRALTEMTPADVPCLASRREK